MDYEKLFTIYKMTRGLSEKEIDVLIVLLNGNGSFDELLNDVKIVNICSNHDSPQLGQIIMITTRGHLIRCETCGDYRITPFSSLS